MTDREGLEAQFLAHLTVVERAAAAVCRRRGLLGDEAAEFLAWAKLRFVQDDYAILQKFRGESSLATYLTVVVAMLFREYRVQRWGRWRPSAAALREGPLAVRLETLVHRDGCELQSAIAMVQSSWRPPPSTRDLVSLYRRLPMRMPVRAVEVGPEPLDAIELPTSADAELLAHEHGEARSAAAATLSAALTELPDEERVIVRLRFWEGLSVADIARALQLPQKPLYRRLERALQELRVRLERAGVTRDEARTLLQELPSE
ncbi:MAG: RNA polymerase sigma factor [Gemmatirosa sp.]